MKPFMRNRPGIRLFGLAMRFANWLNGLPQRMTPPPFLLMQLGSAYWQSRALYVAARLGLADCLGDGKKSADVLAQELGLDADAVCRLLRFLCSLGVFAQPMPGVFINNPVSDCLRSGHPQSVRAMVLMHNAPEMARAWLDGLEKGIRTGKVPFEIENGTDLFGYMDGNREFDLLFAQAMDSVEAVVGDAFLEDVDWGRFERFVDVGGSKGKKALTVLKAAPDIKAVVFDRPQVIDAARRYWMEQADGKCLPRVAFVAGDMFKALPAAESDRDLYAFFAVFHGLGDAEAGRVLANLKIAAGNHRPMLAICELVGDDFGADPFFAAFNMQMLVNTSGRERSLAEWRKLLTENGFDLLEVHAARSFVKFIFASPA